ncbi:MAG: ATP-grasp domain-containing protein [Pseudomonadota bacterium]
MQLLYPCNPFDKNQPDETYEEEFHAARAAGLTCFLFSAEDFEMGEFKPRPANQFQGQMLYRGWMLTPERYAVLEQAVTAKNARLLTSVSQYRQCHYLPEWYSACQDVTPNTIFLSRDGDFETALANTGWQAYFVKDYVKSLTTSRGSIAKNAEEVREIVGLIERYRGQIEGGICVREFEQLLPETEERYFVWRGQVYARDDVVPDIVLDIARRFDTPFFSIDIVLNSQGVARLMELGDGQVSDRKKWDAGKFVEMFKA